MIHELKIYPNYFNDILSRKKTFEVRKNDRLFSENDYLALNEYSHDTGYTGRSIVLKITYVFNNKEYVKEGYVILGFKYCVIAEI